MGLCCYIARGLVQALYVCFIQLQDLIRAQLMTTHQKMKAADVHIYHFICARTLTAQNSLKLGAGVFVVSCLVLRCQAGMPEHALHTTPPVRNY